MSKVKKQTVDITFEKNGQDWGISSDVLHEKYEIELPNGFDAGVHVIGVKVNDSIHLSNPDDPREGGSTPTGLIPMVANLITDKDVEKMVGKVLTVVDATISDKSQKEAFKSLMKQAIYGQYNTVIERSAQNVKAAPYCHHILDE